MDRRGPATRKAVVIGQTYLANVSGNRVRVKLLREATRSRLRPDTFRGWVALNLVTGREVLIKTVARLSDCSQ